MAAFKRLDHLLCDVPDIEQALALFVDELGFPVAWPIGRYWPDARQCGIALGGINLELIQADEIPVQEATIRAIAYKPSSELHKILNVKKIPFTVFEKRESNPELLKLRGLPFDQGEQPLCTNTIIEESAQEFRFFACDYAPILKAALAPSSFVIPNDNRVEEVVIGLPFPESPTDELEDLGIKGGARITFRKHPVKEVTALVMKNGPIEMAGWPARFRFI